MRAVIHLAAVGATVFFLGPVATADDRPDASDAGPGPEALIFADLPDVWSATRTLRSPLDVPNEVTVITADDIRASGATSLVELLETVPSLEVMRVSRSDVNVSARGFNPLVSSRVLAMIDGRSVNIDFTGTVLWESLEVALDEIDRIEVIRGPGSGLYGANALMGIINIITKRPHQLRSLTTRTGIGPESAFTSLTTAKSGENASIKASAKWQVLDSFRNERSPYELMPTDRHTTAQRMKQANTTFEYLFEGGANLSLSGGLTRLDQGIVTQLGPYSLDGMLHYGKANLDLGLWRLQAFVNSLDVDVDTAGSVFPPPMPPAVPFQSRIQAMTTDAEIQRTQWVHNHTLVWGLNLRRIATSSRSYFGGREQEMLYGAFIQDELPLLGDRLLALAGLRLDEHPKSGFQVSPRASLVYKLSDVQRLRFLWARSFRTPTHLSNYAQVFIPNSDPTALAPGIPFIPPFRFTGSEDLDAEELDTYELGYRGVFAERVSLSATVYFNELRNLHAFFLRDPPDPLDIGIESDDRTHAWGAELGTEFALSAAMRCFASYSFQSANGPLERLTPRHKVTAGIRGELLPRVSYSMAARYVSHTTFETDPVDASFVGSSSVPSHLTFDASLMFRPRRDLELGLHARNLFHQTRPHFPLGDEIGSELLATIRWEF
jgi:iron complex outermembrane receptor protein